MNANSPCFNPITICIGICIVLFVIFGVQIGATIGEIAQHIFLPYLIDISRGVGKQGAMAFRGIALVIQLGIIGLVVASCAAKEKNVKTLVSTFGIVLTMLYFVLLVVAYILPRLH